MDLLPHLPHMDVNAVLEGIAQVMPANKVILFSAETGLGVDEWVDWLAERRASIRHDEAAHHAHYTHGHLENQHREHREHLSTLRTLRTPSTPSTLSTLSTTSVTSTTTQNTRAPHEP